MATERKWVAVNVADMTNHVQDDESALRSLVGPVAMIERILPKSGYPEDNIVFVGPAMDDGAVLVNPNTPHVQVDSTITLISGVSYGTAVKQRGLKALAPDIRFYESPTRSGPWTQVTAIPETSTLSAKD